jgi:choline dehydrogenase-like flavoprotein
MNLLAEREDVEALVRAVRRTREIIGTEPIASTVERELLPGAGADVEACIRNTAKTTSHPACSVAMGNDIDSPLDEKLRVRGVDNLRVADASALPQPTPTPRRSWSANAARISCSRGVRVRTVRCPKSGGYRKKLEPCALVK